MKKIIILCLMLALGAGAGTAAWADEPANTSEAWEAITDQYKGHPYVTVRHENLFYLVILAKENPDPEHPVAMDVRTLEGVPVFFFVYENGQANLVWRHPALAPPERVTTGA
jgi:hypothetical protein